MTRVRFISYLRVSTDKQGKSGLGLEAQREAIARYLNGGDWKLIGEYVEVESGKRSDRPKLAKALAHAKQTGATLVIAKLDRLARNVAFVSNLMESRAEFVAVDNPHANRLTIHILAAVAEDEARRTSERTKAALAAAKSRGVKLGGLRCDGAHLRGHHQSGLAAIKQGAAERARDLQPVIDEIRGAGVTSARGIARELNRREILTPRRCGWHAASVTRMLERFRNSGE
jgi:DNA invertase Pin-like site-specific DNA recombinase